ncbi:unnamed protein product [Durusdinium trenchii]|uniref:Mediator of RNA polymerase II transcription subunit 7 n=1 Tax=Durusdinium trenchii TaxID=1381693 RepID=A0ABP0MS95_9DINO
MNLKISIQALSGLDATCEVGSWTRPARRSSSPRHRPSSSSDGRSVKTSNFSNFRALSDFSPEAEAPGYVRWTILLAQVGLPTTQNHLQEPGAGPLGLGDLRGGLSARRKHQRLGASHVCAVLAAAALLAAVGRRTGGGTRSTDAQAAKAVVPAPSCGLLFTAVPHSAPREATLDAEEAQEAAAKAKKGAEAVLPPSLYSSPLYLDLDAEDPEARLARPLQELENHLTSIRTIAMALVPPEPDVPASEAPQLQVVSAPVSPLASVAGQSPAPSSAPEVLAKAPQARDSTGPRSAPWRRIPDHPWGLIPRPPGRPSKGDPNEGDMAKFQAVLATSAMHAAYVHRIKETLEAASALNREASGVIGALAGKLQEMAKDRELWIHRCLAEKEIQQASHLLKRAVHERFHPTPFSAAAAG